MEEVLRLIRAKSEEAPFRYENKLNSPFFNSTQSRNQD